MTFKVGDQVTKRDGYKWPGEVRAVFTTKGGKTRVVVECTVREVTGALHIFAPEQLKGDEEQGTEHGKGDA